MSSDILSRPVDVSKFGLIFAGAQKNLAPAGLTIVIIREDLAGQELPITPAIMNYKSMIDKDSMYNTPPCWCIYMLGLTLDWLDEQGGIEGMEQIKHGKAQMLYDCIDSSKLFTCAAEKPFRSDMNVTFRSASEELDAKFVKEASEAGFVNLKGTAKWAACGPPSTTPSLWKAWRSSVTSSGPSIRPTEALFPFDLPLADQTGVLPWPQKKTTASSRSTPRVPWSRPRSGWILSPGCSISFTGTEMPLGSPRCWGRTGSL